MYSRIQAEAKRKSAESEANRNVQGLRIFVKLLHGATITLEVDLPIDCDTFVDSGELWETIWDKLGVRTDERNKYCWKLIIDGRRINLESESGRTLFDFGIQKDSMLLLVRTSWMVCIKCNIPYGRDATQCSNRVFQRGSDGNCSVCRRSEEEHFSREPAGLEPAHGWASLGRPDGRPYNRLPSQGKAHSNGNQYCFWAPVHLNHDMDPSRGENREYGHSGGRWSGQFMRYLPLDAWYEYCCNCAKTEFDSGLPEDERFSPWRYFEKKDFELAQQPPPSQCAHCKNREATEGEAACKVLRDLQPPIPFPSLRE